MNNTNHSKSIPRRARHHICRWCLLPLLLLLARPAAVEAQFLYTTNNGTITITRYTGPGGAVTIPSTLNGLPVTSIGDSAFAGCSGLTSVTMGPSVTSIEFLAFQLCTSLTSLTIGNSVTSIGDSAFWGCSRLTNVIIPASVTSIGVEAFTACYSLSWIRVDTNNPAYSSVDGVLFNKSETTLFQFPVASAATSYTIPNSVTSIGVAAFGNCSGLASVTFGPGVTSIGDAAFADCTGLTSVSIGNSVTSIGQFTFQSCTSLTNLTIGTSVTNIGYHAFEYCTSLTYLIIPASVTSIVDGAFEGWSSLSWIRVDTNNPAYRSVDGVLFNQSETTLFQYPIASAATSYTIPNSVTSIGHDAFGGCSRLINMTIENNVTSIGDSAFARCSLASVTIGPSVTNIGDYAFSFTSLTNLTIGNGVTSIGDSAFEECRSLTNVTIGSGVTSIGNSAFFDCSSLSSVWMGSSVTSIGYSAFLGCASLMGIYFNGNAPNLEGSPFSGDNNATVYYLPGTTGWGTTFGGLSTALWQQGAPEASTLSASSITTNSATLNGTVNPNGWPTTAWFEWGTTTSYGNLTSVADLGSGTIALPLSAPLAGLPPGITYHFRVAARNDHYGLVYGDDQSFTPSPLPLVSTLPATPVSTGRATLKGTVNPNGWPTTAWFQWGTTINYGSLTSVADLGSGTAAVPLSAPLAALTPGVTYHFRVAATNDFGLAYGSDQSFTTASLESQFAYTTNNGSITITGYTGPGGDVTIPGTINGLPVTSIGDSAFWGQALTSLTIPNSVTFIGDWAFGLCLSLTNVTIPNSVTSIGHMAFEFCGRLTSVSLGNAVTSIGSEPFGDCTNLTSITIDALNPAYSSVEGVLFNKTQTTLVQYPVGLAAASYTIPNGVTSVEDGAFAFCQRLTNITLPSSVTFIGNRAFYTCGSLRSFTIPDGVTSIGDTAFAGCTSLVEVKVGNSVTTIGDGAFSSCPSLTGVYFEGNAPSLGGLYVFSGDNDATVYYLPGTTGWGTTFGGLPTALWQPGPPEASTLTARSSTTNSATLNGTVNPNGNPTTAWFQWGTTTNYGNLTSVIALGSGTTTLPLSAPLAGLTPGVTYHFRVAATNDNGLAYGSDQSFTTATSPSEFNYTMNNGTITITGYTGAGGPVTIPSTLNGLPVTVIGTNAFLACSNLTSVTIPNSVTNISFQAFAGCYRLTNVTIGNSVTAIGSSAFVGCSSMTDITIPNSVTGIGDEAFEGCSSLTTVTIPTSVTDMGYSAFSGCTSLTSVMIPNSLTNIGFAPFANCTSLTAIAVDALNPAYCSVDGVLFNKSQTTLIQCPGGKAGTYMIPNGVTNIAVYAFSGCAYLINIMTPISLTSIGYAAFEGCLGPTSITVPNSVTNIEDFAFSFCTSLTALHFGGNAPSLGGYVFQGDNGATVYYLPGTTDWGTTFGGLPTAFWTQVPTIQASPQSQTAEAASAVGLRVKASSPLPLFYFWYLNATNLLSSGTNWQLELTNLQWSQSGAYTVVISNVLGAITSAPAMLQVIAPVQRRTVPGVLVMGQTGNDLNLDYADSLSPTPSWTPLGSVSLASTSQYYFDLTVPLPTQRFYRAWQAGTAGAGQSLDLQLVPAITLTGSIGHSVRVDAINRVGPTDAWFTLDTVTLTNTSQLYFDTSAWRQPPRLYRLVPSP